MFLQNTWFFDKKKIGKKILWKKSDFIIKNIKQIFLKISLVFNGSLLNKSMNFVLEILKNIILREKNFSRNQGRFTKKYLKLFSNNCYFKNKIKKKQPENFFQIVYY